MKTFSSLKQAVIFLILTFAISWTLQYFIITHGGTGNQSLQIFLMWVPGTVGIICSFVFGRGIVDLGFRKFQLKYFAAAYLVPVAAAAIILLMLIGLKIDHFEIHPGIIQRRGGIGHALFGLLKVCSFIVGLTRIRDEAGRDNGFFGKKYGAGK